MENGEPVLVYPGGGHEVLKKKTDKKYGLMWKKRAGLKHILPFLRVTFILIFKS